MAPEVTATTPIRYPRRADATAASPARSAGMRTPNRTVLGVSVGVSRYTKPISRIGTTAGREEEVFIGVFRSTLGELVQQDLTTFQHLLRRHSFRERLREQRARPRFPLGHVLGVRRPVSGPPGHDGTGPAPESHEALAPQQVVRLVHGVHVDPEIGGQLPRRGQRVPRHEDPGGDGDHDLVAQLLVDGLVAVRLHGEEHPEPPLLCCYRTTRTMEASSGAATRGPPLANSPPAA